MEIGRASAGGKTLLNVKDLNPTPSPPLNGEGRIVKKKEYGGCEAPAVLLFFVSFVFRKEVMKIILP
jgi:hypothetical protein